MKISIVMPSFNQSSYVEAALNSVFSQNYKNWEILFIDGGSTDNTMQVIEKYRDRLAYCVSESDKGQSDALHKGFSRATGEILTWLNTDDLLLPDALSEAAKAFTDKPARCWVFGNVIWIDAKDNIIKCWRGESYTPGWPRLGLLAAGGPSAFFRRELYERVGGINLNLHYVMDTELWWRFAMAGEHFYRLSSYTWALRLHEDAKVSGHMFATEDNPKQQAVSKRKREENIHIFNLTSTFCIIQDSRLAKFLSVCRRLASPAYLTGIIDNFMWRGKKLNSMCKFRPDTNT
jgi:glycosyltransferase involved in cell wall biosynthesis